jgi:hypothetical protein
MPRRRWRSGVAVAVLVSAATVSLVAQTTRDAGRPAPSGKSTVKPSAWKTPWGHPDLQGLWNNSTTTPLERPARFAGREFMTEAEARSLDEAAEEANDRRPADRTADVNGAYNQFWWERGATVSTRRTSLIVDPPDGRLPALTAEGQRRAAEARALMAAVPRGPEDRNLAERCLTRGAPKLPGGYNNHFQILQTPQAVVILQEMIHEVRVIPLDGRPHLRAGMKQWMGDSRGRWEGKTLVVETTNYRDEIRFHSFNCCPGAGQHTRVVERFTRTDEGTIDYTFTVEDPTVYTRPFTVSVPMVRSDGPMFEYACHEHNYGMTGILSGARAQEQGPPRAGEGAATPPAR